MKRSVTYYNFGGGHSEATLIIDKDGMHVKDKNPTYENDDYFISNYITDCINMDGWKYSWHMDVSKGRIKRSKTRRELREIMLGKIKTRESEIQILKDGINILGRWHY